MIPVWAPYYNICFPKFILRFGKFSDIKDTKLLEEEISLNSEDVRIAILKRNIEFVEKALDKGK